MILVLALAIFALTNAASANTVGAPATSGEPDNNFLARKQELYSHLNLRINHLISLQKTYQTTQQILALRKVQQCVGNSQNQAVMKNCLDQGSRQNALSNGKSRM